jgi:hypothetical protein
MTDTYVISVVDKERNIGVQHIRQGWGAAIHVAIEVAKEHPDALFDEDRVITGFETNQCYESPDGTVVVITQPDSEE